MQIVRVEDLQPGMKLARPVFNADGSLLLNRDVVLKESYIRRLKALGYFAVYIGEGDDGLTNEAISLETQVKATRAVADALNSVRIGKTIDVEAIADSATSIIEDVLSRRDIVTGLSDICSYDQYTFTHSVNVGLLSAVIGLGMGLSRGEVQELTIGALLHDIGKVLIDDAIISKAGGLTAEEWEEIKRHPYYGFQLLRQTPGISARAAHAAYQHHERMGGQGYPRGLAGKEIHLFGRIVAVADSYDAMTSDRVYRRGKAPYDALRVIRSLKEVHYDPEVADALLKNICPYPVGCTVELNTGEIGVVVDVHRKKKHRPVVCLQYDTYGYRLAETINIDLSQESRREIKRIVVG